jgi:hypothetical protein
MVRTFIEVTHEANARYNAGKADINVIAKDSAMDLTKTKNQLSGFEFIDGSTMKSKYLNDGGILMTYLNIMGNMFATSVGNRTSITVYANENPPGVAEQQVSFRLWDSNECSERWDGSIAVGGDEVASISFEPDGDLGSFLSPVAVNFTDAIARNIDVSTGERNDPKSPSGSNEIEATSSPPTAIEPSHRSLHSLLSHKRKDTCCSATPGGFSLAYTVIDVRLPTDVANILPIIFK